MLIILGGTITLVSEAYLPYVSGGRLFVWLMLLSSLMVGQFIITYTIVSAWMHTPTQAKDATTH